MFLIRRTEWRVLAFAACLAAAAPLAIRVGRTDAAVFANFDANQFTANGFSFSDFNSFEAVEVSDGLIHFDIAVDTDAQNGLFGGSGSDISANFDAATTQLEVTLTVDPLNLAGGFNVVLVDNDGPTSGEEWQFNFSLAGIPAGQVVTLTQNLLSPGPVYTQPAFEQDPGDGVQNYGLRQVQLQSLFGGTDRLKIDLASIKLVDPEDPLLIELTPATYASQPQRFTFGTFSELAAFNPATFIINANPAGTGGPNGGFGFNGLNVDFEATDYQLEIEAKLLTTNTAEQFNLLLGDNDGNDSGPGLGSEDYNFTVDTANFNTSGFTTFTIPLGSGSENSIVTTFGFTNGGDGLQNFDLSQMQIQAGGEDPGILGIEVLRMSIVERTQVAGDYNGNGVVDAADYTTWRDSFGQSGPSLPADGDGNGTVNNLDYSYWKTRFGNIAGSGGGEGAAATVPEPTGLILVIAACTATLFVRRS